MSDADEILKLKKLLDAGVITQEEFEREKKMIFDTSRERREAVTAYTRAASARRGAEEKGPEHSAADETDRALYSAIADAAGVMGADHTDHSATEFPADDADAGVDAGDAEKEGRTASVHRERTADTGDVRKRGTESVRDGARTKSTRTVRDAAEAASPRENRSSSGVRIRAALFAVFLWPVGFIYVLRKKPFRKGKNIAIAVIDGILSVLLIVGVTLGLLLFHYRAQLNALHQAAEAAAGGAEAGADTVSSAAQKIASDSVSGGETSYDDFVAGLKTTLSSTYGDNFSVEDDGKTLTISIWQDGVAKEAAYIVDGIETNDDAWNNMKAAVQNLASTCFLSANANGASRHVCVNILNDQNQSNVLLSYLDGECIYDAVESAISGNGTESGNESQTNPRR